MPCRCIYLVAAVDVPTCDALLTQTDVNLIRILAENNLHNYLKPKDFSNVRRQVRSILESPLTERQFRGEGHQNTKDCFVTESFLAHSRERKNVLVVEQHPACEIISFIQRREVFELSYDGKKHTIGLDLLLECFSKPLIDYMNSDKPRNKQREYLIAKIVKKSSTLLRETGFIDLPVVDKAIIGARSQFLSFVIMESRRILILHVCWSDGYIPFLENIFQGLFIKVKHIHREAVSLAGKTPAQVARDILLSVQDSLSIPTRNKKVIKDNLNKVPRIKILTLIIFHHIDRYTNRQLSVIGDLFDQADLHDLPVKIMASCTAVTKVKALSIICEQMPLSILQLARPQVAGKMGIDVIDREFANLHIDRRTQKIILIRSHNNNNKNRSTKDSISGQLATTLIEGSLIERIKNLSKVELSFILECYRSKPTYSSLNRNFPNLSLANIEHLAEIGLITKENTKLPLGIKPAFMQYEFVLAMILVFGTISGKLYNHVQAKMKDNVHQVLIYGQKVAIENVTSGIKFFNVSNKYAP